MVYVNTISSHYGGKISARDEKKQILTSEYGKSTCIFQSLITEKATPAPD